MNPDALYNENKMRHLIKQQQLANDAFLLLKMFNSKKTEEQLLQFLHNKLVVEDSYLFQSYKKLNIV